MPTYSISRIVSNSLSVQNKLAQIDDLLYIKKKKPHHLILLKAHINKVLMGTQ